MSKLVEYHKPKNVIHVGAHLGEEVDSYYNYGVDHSLWVEANVDLMRQLQSNISRYRNARSVNAVLIDVDDKDVVFNISNNVQSSSILEFGTHSQEHPGVIYVDKIKLNSITIDTFFERNNIDASKYNFWNFDIQGAELMALKGATQSIKYAKAIYLEVNEKELYKDCGLINDVDNFLSQYNFKRVLTVMTTHGWGDALYILDN